MPLNGTSDSRVNGSAADNEFAPDDARIRGAEITRNRILLAVAYLQAHLDEELDLQLLAAIAGFSPFHFHRTFHAVVGETVSQHVRRLRLEQAALRLRTTDVAVTTVALDAGYETHTAFAKAFRQMYGVSPSEWRSSGPQRTAKAAMLEIALTGAYVAHHSTPEGTKERPMFQEVRTLTPQRIVYVELPFGDETGIAGPREAWSKIRAYGEINQLEARTRMGMGMVMDNMATTPASRVRYRACYFVNDDAPLPADPAGQVQEGLSEAGKYAVFLYEGSWDGMGDAWGRVFASALPATNLDQRDAPIFEVYLNAAAADAGETPRTELFVAVK